MTTAKFFLACAECFTFNEKPRETSLRCGGSGRRRHHRGRGFRPHLTHRLVRSPRNALALLAAVERCATGAAHHESRHPGLLGRFSAGITRAVRRWDAPPGCRPRHIAHNCGIDSDAGSSSSIGGGGGGCEHTADGKAPAVSGVHENRSPFAVHSANVRPVVNQNPTVFRNSFSGGDHQRGLPIACSRINGRVRLEKLSDARETLRRELWLAHCVVQRRHSLCVAPSHIGAPLQKHSHCAVLPVVRSQNQAGLLLVPVHHPGQQRRGVRAKKSRLEKTAQQVHSPQLAPHGEVALTLNRQHTPLQVGHHLPCGGRTRHASHFLCKAPFLVNEILPHRFCMRQTPPAC